MGKVVDISIAASWLKAGWCHACRLSGVTGGEDEVKSVLDSFQEPAAAFSLAPHLGAIESCFSKDTVWP